jgi:hypothetical protein
LERDAFHIDPDLMKRLIGLSLSFPIEKGYIHSFFSSN